MSILEKVFGFDAKSMTLKTEFVAGVTIFLTMSYILAVNPAILSTTGMDKGALFTGTAIASAIATILLAVMAKLPFAQSCSMGLNAFFAYTLCLTMGYSWQQALAILLIEGLIFIIITFFNIREKILYAIPLNLRYAISVGIGMFIAFIGLKNAGIIVAHEIIHGLFAGDKFRGGNIIRPHDLLFQRCRLDFAHILIDKGDDLVLIFQVINQRVDVDAKK